MMLSLKIKKSLALIPGVLWLKRKISGVRAARVFKTLPVERGAPPKVDPAALKAEYAASAISREPDTFVLYRVIGNDLYPRHRKGQCRENLQFILENEAPLEGCEKRFVVNRIFDPDEERHILELLERANTPCIHIPFDPNEYSRIGWDIHGVPVEYAPFDADFPELHETYRERLMMRLYRHKNNYVMNNNGARNVALHDGRKVAKWVLPWDGNCFVTERSWQEIRQAVTASPQYPYHIVPMARILDNKEVLDREFQPEADEEPQVIFRSDAGESFDAECFYGRRPKVELLWRLGVPGQWDYWAVEPWDVPCPPYSPDAGKWTNSGWVVRLSSGKPSLERGESSPKDRGRARVEAIAAAIDSIDEKVFGSRLDESAPVFVPMNANEWPESAALSGQLEQAAEEALDRGPYSIIDETTRPPVRDRTPLQRMYDDTFVLALAFAKSGRQEHAEHAARLVRRWFLDPGTAMNPHLRFAAVQFGRSRHAAGGAGIIEAKDVYYFLDAVRMLSAAGTLSSGEQQQLKAWFAKYLQWLVESPEGRREKSRPNNHGTYYDLHVAAVAAYLGDYLLLRNTLRDSRFRIITQFTSTGEQPEELKRAATAHYCCFNLQGWINLATLAGRCGEDLWSFEGPQGQNLWNAMRWVLKYMDREWPYEQAIDFDRARFLPIYHTYRQLFADDAGVDREFVPPINEIKPIFHPHDGIRPFWQIGRRSRERQ